MKNIAFIKNQNKGFSIKAKESWSLLQSQLQYGSK